MPKVAKRKSNGKHPPTAASNYRIPYEDAVAEGKEIIKTMDSQQMRLGELQLRLGELADRVDKTKYRDRTVATLEKAIGYQTCTLKECLPRVGGRGKKSPGAFLCGEARLAGPPEARSNRKRELEHNEKRSRSTHARMETRTGRETELEPAEVRARAVAAQGCYLRQRY